ncbi:MAG: hypothetical protein ACI4KM_12480 [Oscillospiraceae bacterium]
MRTEQITEGRPTKPNIMRILEQARRYEAAITSVEAHIRRVKRIASAPHDSFEYAVELAEKLNRLENELNREIDLYVAAKLSALEYISLLDGEERAVIERYYLLNQDWQKIADEMYMSERRVFILRKSALKRMGAI